MLFQKVGLLFGREGVGATSKFFTRSRSRTERMRLRNTGYHDEIIFVVISFAEPEPHHFGAVGAVTPEEPEPHKNDAVLQHWLLLDYFNFIYH
jgi:hypothetical protein